METPMSQVSPSNRDPKVREGALALPDRSSSRQRHPPASYLHRPVPASLATALVIALILRRRTRLYTVAACPLVPLGLTLAT